MPRLAVVFLSLLLPLTGVAAPAVTTLRALLLVADDYEDPEDNAIAQSVRVDLANVTNFLNLIERRKLARVETTLVRGRDVTAKKALAALKAMPSGADDVLFVYFTGHGGMDEGVPFLAMATGNGLERQTLLSALDAKPARLRIMVADACTNEISEPVRTRSFKRTKGAKPDEGRFDEIYRTLLYGYRGNLYATASSEGEYAWSDDKTGAVFTKFFIRDGLLMDPAPSWNTVFETARWKTMQAFSRMDPKTIAESKSEGSHNQTPKLIAAPVALTTAQPPVEKPPVVKPPVEKPPVPSPSNEDANGVKIANRTDEAIVVRIDRNTPDREWKRERLERKTLAPGASLSLSSPALIGYGERRDVQWFELEDGEFAFISDGDDVELAEVVDGEIVRDEIDLDDLLEGTFEVVSSRRLSSISFNEDEMKVRLRRGKPLSGTWKVEDAEKVEGEDVFPLVFSTNEGGKRVAYSFALIVQDEDTLVLVLLDRKVGKRSVDASEGPFDEVTVLQRE